MPGPYYKALDANGCSCNGGHSKWSLPVLQADGAYKPGRWMPRIAGIEPCRRGYHLFGRKDTLLWLNATLYEAEYCGAFINHDNKVVVESARLLRPLPGYNDRTLRLFACRCAEDVLPRFEAQHPGDNRPRAAIETARRYADGKATAEELAAAWAAARAAAWAAARAAARAAAGDAAGDAARDAARAAAGAAAGDAARAAAWAAARAAAGAAAWDAARDAAWDAAWAEYRGWLWEALEGKS